MLCCTGIITVAAQSGVPLKLKQTIPLPGVEGRIDHFAFDPAGERLFVCALGNNTAEVLDLHKGQRIHSITGLGTPQGIAYIPELDRIFVANDKGGICKIYDGKSFQPVGELNFKDDADNIRYDEATKKIYVGFGSGGIAVVNAPDGKQVGSIKLSGHPEAFQLEKGGNRIFVNVPNSTSRGGSRSRQRRSHCNMENRSSLWELPYGARRSESSIVCRLPSSLQACRAQH